MAAQWHPFKNGSLTPADVTPGSGRKAWWLCPKGNDHEWDAAIYNRNRGAGCPICSNQRVAVSNSLGTVNPKLAREWHTEKNGALTPFDVLPSTKAQVWWQCTVNPTHVWRAKLNNRANGKGCPYCANQHITKENSLGAVNLALASQWHPTKNGSLTPFYIAPSAKKRVWWKCRNGDDHEWEATVNHRATGTGCPKCNPVWSVPELRIYTELQSIFQNIEHRFIFNGVELDLYIPELGIGIGIEYDGVYWHHDKVEKDTCKNQAVASKIMLIRIREEGLPLISPHDIETNKKRIPISTIKELLKRIGKNHAVTPAQALLIHEYQSRKTWIASKEFERLYAERKYAKPEKSLATLHPKISREWHPKKNNGLSPSQFTPGSGKVVWWLGPCGHEWQDSILHRKHNRGCPQCRYLRASATRRKNKTEDQIDLFD
ncbi:zinc-ribbon domain-containing protein [Congregibacter brevis]|uniref:Zinc-ribbon domain-containing protein n=1 Tax=Congregibacter brevis TaxID=3081201 RepID=A0ABZ0IEM4_9GAMM|nr:zinc-ribbon domain-containing protein [Congregibacter sp. IMCC45268]